MSMLREIGMEEIVLLEMRKRTEFETLKMEWREASFVFWKSNNERNRGGSGR